MRGQRHNSATSFSCEHSLFSEENRSNHIAISDFEYRWTALALARIANSRFREETILLWNCKKKGSSSQANIEAVTNVRIRVVLADLVDAK